MDLARQISLEAWIALQRCCRIIDSAFCTHQILLDHGSQHFQDLDILRHFECLSVLRDYKILNLWTSEYYLLSSSIAERFVQQVKRFLRRVNIWTGYILTLFCELIGYCSSRSLRHCKSNFIPFGLYVSGCFNLVLGSRIELLFSNYVLHELVVSVHAFEQSVSLHVVLLFSVRSINVVVIYAHDICVFLRVLYKVFGRQLILVVSFFNRSADA